MFMQFQAVIYLTSFYTKRIKVEAFDLEASTLRVIFIVHVLFQYFSCGITALPTATAGDLEHPSVRL